MKEIVGDKRPGFSAAAGLSSEDLAAAADDPDSDGKLGAFWIVEPRRNQHIVRWSGSNEHKTSNLINKGIMGVTVGAFTHYAFAASDYAVVFADLESKLAAVVLPL